MNFGGFIPLSTIDWRGRAVCTVFFRGCPIRCSYCQNEGILTGEDFRDLEEIKEMITSSAPYISGVMFSGGEPTRQREALMELARYSKGINLDVGIQTNGLFPDTLGQLLEERLVDKVALDFKSRFEGYSGQQESGFNFENYEKNVRKSFTLCKNAYARNILTEFEVVITIFYENEEYIEEISGLTGKVPLVLQQGEHKMLRLTTPPLNMTEGEYRERKRQLQEKYHPLTLDEIKRIADKLGRKVRIRTREVGEIIYKGREGP
ncbi:MAG TPA: anaerobic ribonucleoside-triphosphate reductase activating protein [Methanoregula sp.]|nr:anaerobic ribonucleoside-triphosphate reductase activating protein [Methanoregula sp.]